MSTMYSVGSIQGYQFDLVKNNEKNNDTPISPEISYGQLENLIKKTSIAVSKFCDTEGNSDYSVIGSNFSDTITPRGQGNQATKNLLNDYHETFPIFNKSLHKAIEITKSGGDIAVEVHKSDIKNNNFLSILKKIKDAKIPTFKITLEIFSKKNEFYDNQTIRQLRGAHELGFKFGMYDFMEGDNGEINTNNIINIIKNGLVPRYIKIKKGILNIINSSINKGALALYKNLTNAGIKIIEIIPEKENPEIKAKYTKEAMEIIENASIEAEGVYRLDGVKYGSELLIRFSDGLTIIDGLNQLKLSDTTGLLMQKNIEKAANIIKNIGTRTFLNVYVKDLGQPGFREVISSILREIHKNDRKKIIFEILEDRYGHMDELVIANIRYIKNELGCAIAIDDLCIDDDDGRGMSMENLETLYEYKIFPDYIKIDGKDIDNIRTGKLSEEKIKNLRETIGMYSLLQSPPPIFIAEWIQDTEHALQIKQTLGTSKTEFLYQGRNIQNGKFGLK